MHTMRIPTLKPTSIRRMKAASSIRKWTRRTKSTWKWISYVNLLVWIGIALILSILSSHLGWFTSIIRSDVVSSPIDHVIIPTFYARDSIENRTIADVQGRRIAKLIEGKMTNISDNDAKIEIRWSSYDEHVKVCRFTNGCMGRNGEFLIDMSVLKKGNEENTSKSEMIVATLNGCGVKVSDLYDRHAWLKDKSHEKTRVKYIPVDMFNISVSDPHIPHFFMEALPMLYAYDMMFPSRTLRDERSDLKRMSIPERSRLAPGREEDRSENVGVMVSNQVVKRRISSWVGQFISMMCGRLALIFSKDSIFSELLLSQSSEEQTSSSSSDLICFKSVTMMRHKHYYLRNPSWYDWKNSFYSSNWLERRPREESGRGSDGDGTIKLNVTIVDRDMKSGRNIKSVGRFRDQLAGHLRRGLLASGSESGRKVTVKLRVDIVYFEHLSFAEQVTVMQRTDVMVGGHGAGFSNLVFMRSGGSAIEIFPFMYYGGSFERVAKTLGLHYHSVKSSPDEKAFMECVGTTLQRKHGSAVAEYARRTWRYARGAVNESEVDEEERIKDYARSRHEGISEIRVCARYQSLQVDARLVSEHVLQSVSILK